MSLANCLKKSGKNFTAREKVALRVAASENVGMDKKAAEIAAVEAALAEAQAERQEVIDAVFEELPALAERFARGESEAQSDLTSQELGNAQETQPATTPRATADAAADELEGAAKPQTEAKPEGEKPMFSRQADAIGEYALERGTDKRGQPAFANQHILIANGVSDPVSRGDGVYTHHWTVYDRTKPGEGGARFLKVGILYADLDQDGKFPMLRSVAIYSRYKQKGMGYGESIVASLLASNGKGYRMGVENIQHHTPDPVDDALPFWRKMGVRLFNYSTNPDTQIDGDLTLADYLKSRGERSRFSRDADRRGVEGPAREAAEPSAAEGPQGARGDALTGEPGADAGRARGRQGVLGREPGSARGARAEVARRTASIREAVEPIIKAWGNAPEVVLINSMADAPAAVRAQDEGQRSQGATGTPEAFIYRNKVYLVAEGIASPASAVRALLHESVGHFGLRGVFGDRLNPVLDDVAKSMPGRVKAKAREYGLDFESVDERRQAAEEVLAEMAQSTPRAGIVRRAIAAIREFLRGLGIDLELSDNDIIVSFLIPARAFVERGRRGAGLEPASTLAFGRSGLYTPENVKASITPELRDALKRNDLLGFDSISEAAGAILQHEDWKSRWEADKELQQIGDAWRQSVGLVDRAMFSRAAAATADDAPPSGNRASWDAEEPGKLDAFIRVLQDKHIDTKRVVQAIKNATGALADSVDVYLQEELFHGKTAKAVHDFLDAELRPLLTDMSARGVTMAELEEYLHARHAEERNVQIAKVNPEMPDGGSGMDTADARAYLEAIAPAKRRAYEALAARVDAINAETRRELVAYVLESPEAIRVWEETYRHYVPLQREDMEGGFGTGQGFSVRGSQKRATGSKRVVVDILANIAMQRERAIVRGEKNRVANALVGLAVANPNPDFWRVDRPKTIKYIDERTGQVAERPDPLFKSRENVVVARMPDASGNVVEHAVVFNDRDERAMRMATALKNLDAHDMGEVLGLAAKVTRYFASINTQYNPVFGVVNLTRDTQGALFNLSSTPLAGKQREVMQHTLSALRGIYIDERAARKGEQPRSAWAALWDEFQKEGGQTGYRDMFRTSKDRAEAIERELKRAAEGKAKGLGRAVFDWLSDYNQAMENAVRLASYKVGKESGLSNQRAASLAKNLTVNFNRRGSYGTQIGALYAFFNASVQGTARLVETLRGPAGKKIITGGILLGSMQALLLAASGFDEDEPPDFVRQRNLIIPIGGKKYITIPMPLGLHFLPNIGRIPTEFVLAGFRDPHKRIAEFFDVFTDAFNPVGSAGLSLQTIAPTIIDPVAALAENKDWTGKPIARKDFNALNPTPGHTRAKDTASEFSKAVSKSLNWLSGGTNYKPGLFSPTPDQIDYLIGQVAGGLGREAMKAEQTVTSAFTGEELPTYKIPLFGRFYGSSEGQAAQGNTFYDNLRAINAHEAEIKGRRKAGEPVVEYVRENPEAGLIKYANHVERQVSTLRRRRRELIKKGAPRDQVKAIDNRITDIMTNFNQRVRALRGKEAA